MCNESDIATTPCDAAFIEDARSELTRTIQQHGAWNDQCDQAGRAYIEAMTQSGLDEKTVIKKLRDLGLSSSGAAKLIRQVDTRRKLSEAAAGLHEPIDRSGLRFLWWIMFSGWLPLAGTGAIGIVFRTLEGYYDGIIFGTLFLGPITYGMIWIRTKLLNDG